MGDFVKGLNLDEVFLQFCLTAKYHRHLVLLIMAYIMLSSVNSGSNEFIAGRQSYSCADPGFNEYVCHANGTHRCKKFTYDKPDTFVAEFDLGCQDWKRDLVRYVASFGYIIGPLIIGPLSDRFGRKTIFLITAVFGGVIGLAKSFSPFYWVYLLFEFLGAFGDGTLPLLVLGLEMMATKHRILFTVLAVNGFNLGGTLLPMGIWFVPNFRIFLGVLNGIIIFFFLYFFVIDESPRWLLNKERREDADAVIQRISQVNRINVDTKAIDVFLNDEEENTSYLSTLRLTFTSKKMVIRLIVCALCWIASSFTSDGLLQTPSVLDANNLVTSALIASTQIGSSIVGALIMDNQARKSQFLIFLFISAILCWIHPFVPMHNPKVAMVMFLFGLTMNSFFFFINYLYTIEVFPTKTRVTMIALCSCVAQVGGLIAPLTLTLAKYWYGLPHMVFGGVLFLAGLGTFLVPETYRDCLPESVKEAKALGTKGESGFKAIFHPNIQKDTKRDCCGYTEYEKTAGKSVA